MKRIKRFLAILLCVCLVAAPMCSALAEDGVPAVSEGEVTPIETGTDESEDFSEPETPPEPPAETEEEVVPDETVPGNDATPPEDEETPPENEVVDPNAPGEGDTVIESGDGDSTGNPPAETDPEPGDAPEDTGKTEDPAAIDYSQSAAASPAFCQGYAELKPDTTAYAESGIDAQVLGAIGGGVVYVLGRATSGQADRLSVAFDWEGVRYAWVDADRARPMTPDEVSNFIIDCSAREDVCALPDHPELLLDKLECAPAAANGAGDVVAPVSNDGASDEPVSPPDAKLVVPQDSFTLGVGETCAIGAGFDDGETHGPIIYKPESAEIVSVSEDGVITALAAGETTVLVHSDLGEAQVHVTVKAAPTGVTLSAPRTVLGVNEALQLEAALPEGEEFALSFTTSDASIATVNASGLVTTYAPGAVTITAKTYNELSASVTLTVLPAPEGIALNLTELTLGVGQTAQLMATLTPANAANFYTFRAEPEGAVQVDPQTGRIEALAPGAATVTVETYNHKTASCQVTVNYAPAAVAFAEAEIIIGVNEYANIPLNFTAPEGATADAVCTTSCAYASTKAKVASVDGAGNIRGRKAGTAYIVATTHNNLTATLKVTVMKAPSRVYLYAPSLILGKGDCAQLTVGFSSKAYSRALLFQSSNPDVLAVDEKGYLTAAATGNATISVSTYNGKSASLYFAVVDGPDSIALNVPEQTLGVGQRSAVSATLPEGTAGTYTFESDHPDIVEVNANSGALTAMATGTATITVRAYNGTNASATLRVVEAPDTIELAETYIYMGKGEWSSVPKITIGRDDGAECHAAYYYSSSKSKVVTVYADGTLWARKAGKAVITVGTHNGKYAFVTIRVQKAPKRVYLSAARTTLGQRETMQLGAWTNSGAATRTITYASSDESIVTVDANGLVTAHSKGYAVITATAFNGKAASLGFTVVDEPGSIALNLPQEGKVAVAQPVSVTATLPEGSAGSYTFRSENPDIIEVNENTGALNAKAKGTANITVTAYNGVFKTEEITVVPAPESIELAETYIYMGAGEWSAFPKITIDEGSQATFYYASSKPKVVTVYADGTLWARKAGTAVITVATHNQKYAYLTVRVQKAPKRVYLSAARTTLGEGERMQLGSWMNSGAVSRGFTYASSDESIVTVDASGLVTAHSKGYAVITATAFNGKYASLGFTVVDEPGSIALNLPQEGKVAVAQPVSVTATLPEGSAGSYTFRSDDPDIIEVDENTGALNAKAKGTANITVTAYNGVFKTEEITVVPAPENIELAETYIEIGVGEWSAFPKITIDEGSQATFYYASSKPKVVTVYADGTLWARKAGTAVITVATHNQKYAYLTVRVLKAPKRVYIYGHHTTLGVGETMQLSSWVNSGAVSRAVAYTSNNEAVLKVTNAATGEIEAVSPGSAAITVATYNGKYASLWFTVLEAPTSVALTPKPLTLGAGEWYTIGSTTQPENSGGGRTYSIDAGGESVATIDPTTGVIHALTAGTATVRVTMYNNLCTDAFALTVKAAPTGIRLNNGDIVLSVGDSFQIPRPTPLGEDVHSETFAYASNKTKYVTVNAAGWVYAKKKGSARITVATYNGCWATFNVTVKAAPKSIGFMEAEHRLFMNRQYTPVVWFANGVPGNYTLASSDDTIVRVCEDGRTVESLRPGRVTLTAVSYNGKYAWMQIWVPELPEWVKLDPASLTLGRGDSATVRAVVAEGAGAEMTFASDNDGVASFESVDNETITVTAAGVGDTTIRVTSQNGKEGAASVKVLEAPTALSLSPSRAERCIEEKALQLSWGFGAAGEGGRVEFTSSNPAVATVDGNGLVTFVGIGTARITARTYNGHEAACDLRVGEKPGKMFFEQESYKVALGDRVRISASFDKGCESYSFSANDGCVTVSGDTVYGASLGKATLTATSHFGLTATCEVEVVPAPTGIKADIEEVIELVVGISSTRQLHAIPLLNGEPSVGTVHYATSDPQVAVVDYDTGLVTPKGKGADGKGECTITATTYNGFETTYQVKVSYLLEGRKIGLDPGHQAKGNMDKERKSPNSKATKYKCAHSSSGVAHVSEHIINLQVGLQLRDALQKLGAEVYMTRETADVDISNKQRAELMNYYGVDFVLRLHCNAASTSSAQGLSIIRRKSWAYGGAVTVGDKVLTGSWVKSEENRLGRSLATPYINATGCKWRGLGTSDEYTMNNWSMVPCLLVELGFMTHPTEGKKLVQPDYQHKMIVGLVNGICDYYGVARPTEW